MPVPGTILAKNISRKTIYVESGGIAPEDAGMLTGAEWSVYGGEYFELLSIQSDREETEEESDVITPNALVGKSTRKAKE